jgi:CRISPR-associated protein Csb1
MNDHVAQWLDDSGPVALLLREHLEPAAGEGAIVFPPTFAPESDDEAPGYSIDRLSTGNVCLIDSVGSQANRLEALFLRSPYRELVPQVTVEVRGRSVSILEAGHRAADAVFRFSELCPKFQDAFLAYRDRGDAEPLAKLAPLSLVFGAWDSRATGAKIPRLIESTIRAYGVEGPLSRSAQYFSSLEHEDLESFGVDITTQRKVLSEHGLLDSPSGRTPGGIIARGGIVREALANLVVARALGARDEESTAKLQRYVLSLALIALSAPTERYLRQGCLLVPSRTRPSELLAVWRDGRREPFSLSASDALTFAQSAAEAFGVGPNLHGRFDPDKLADELKKQRKKKSAP